MNKLSGLTFRYMKTNIHRTVTTIIGVTLSAILMYSIFTCGFSMMDNTLYDFYTEYMKWDAAFVCDGDTAREILTLAPYYGKESAMKDEDTELENAWIMTKDKLGLITAVNDFNAMSNPPELSSGVFPSGKNGVIVTKAEALYEKVRLGDKKQFMNVEWYNNCMESGRYTEEDLADSVQEKTVCGIMTNDNYTAFEYYIDEENLYNDDNEYVPSADILELMTEEMYDRDDLCVFITLKDHHDIKATVEKIANNFGVEKYHVNNNAVLYFNGTDDEDTMDNLAFNAILLLFAAIIGMFSIIMVRNAFNISVKERSNDYGILRCIGMTRRQIVKIIMGEAIVIGLIGATLGCLIGHGLSVLFFKLIDGIINTEFNFTATMTIHFYWKALLASTLCVFVVTCYSMIAPIERLYRLNPINALRKVESFKKSELKGKIHKSKGGLLTKLFGVEIGYAYNSAVRSKGRFIATVLTLAVGTTFFITIFNSTRTIKQFFTKFAANGIAVGEFELSYDEDIIGVCSDLNKIDVVDKYQMQSRFVAYKRDENENAYKRRNLNQDAYSFGGVSENEYKALLSKSAKKAPEKEGCINVISVVWNRDESDKTAIKEVGYTGLVEGVVDDIKINVVAQVDREAGIELIKNMNPNLDEMDIIEGYSYNYIYCIGQGEALSETYAKEGYIEYYNGMVAVFLDLDKDTYKFENYVYNTYYSYYDELAEVKEALNSIKITTMVAGVVGTLVLLMFLTNVINFQKAQMMVRREEFAILRSIGMSLKQKKKMLFAENSIAIFIAFVIGNVLGYYFSRQITTFLMFDEEGPVRYGITGVLISFIALAAIGFVITFFTKDEDSFDPVNQFSIE